MKDPCEKCVVKMVCSEFCNDEKEYDLFLRDSINKESNSTSNENNIKTFTTNFENYYKLLNKKVKHNVIRSNIRLKLLKRKHKDDIVGMEFDEEVNKEAIDNEIVERFLNNGNSQ